MVLGGWERVVVSPARLSWVCLTSVLALPDAWADAFDLFETACTTTAPHLSCPRARLDMAPIAQVR